MTYILNILVGVVKVWNLAQKNSYASCFVMIDYVLYPLFRSWCGIDSTGFVTVFLLKNQRRKRTFEFELTWKVFSVLKPPFVSVPVSVLVKKNLSSRNLISRWLSGIILNLVSVVTFNGHYDCLRVIRWFLPLPWMSSIILTCGDIGVKRQFPCPFFFFVEYFPYLFL